MKNKTTITILVFLIVVAAAIAASVGIFSTGGPGVFEYESIRGEVIQIYGQGLYRHMSADVAVQGIGQDYVTLFIAIPLVLIFLLWSRSGSVRGMIALAGTLGYFLVTYLFYIIMAMYNFLFLLYAFLLGTVFFAFTLIMLDLGSKNMKQHFSEKAPAGFAGGLLIVNSLLIGLLWLSRIIPPLLDGSIYPASLQHYTTLIVQGMDIGLLLPLAFVSGLLLMKKKQMGFLLGPVYLVFLSLLMTALTAKIIAMGLTGQNIIPVIVIIPTILAVTALAAVLMLRSVRESRA
ncbi:MAG: hypothetical protein ACLFR1_05005 [Spirochaetia bacterium]